MCLCVHTQRYSSIAACCANCHVCVGVGVLKFLKTPTPTHLVFVSYGNFLYSGVTSGITCSFIDTDPINSPSAAHIQVGGGTCCVTGLGDDITSIGKHWYISQSPLIDYPDGWYRLNITSYPLFDNRLVQITSGLVTQQLYC